MKLIPELKLKSIIVFGLFLMAFSIYTSTARAGWVITGKIVDREGRTILKRFFIENQQIKVEQYNLIYSCNLKTKSLILVDPEKLLYVETNFDAYYTKLLNLGKARIETSVAGAASSIREQLKNQYLAQLIRNIDIAKHSNDTVQIDLVDDSVKYLSRTCSKYQIFTNGIKREEFLFWKNAELASGFNLEQFLAFAYMIETDNNALTYRAPSGYTNQFAKGFVLRSYMYQDGYKTEWQVNNIEEKKVPLYEFGKPDLCKQLTLEQWFARRNEVTTSETYDDYE